MIKHMIIKILNSTDTEGGVKREPCICVCICACVSMCVSIFMR